MGGRLHTPVALPEQKKPLVATEWGEGWLAMLAPSFGQDILEKRQIPCPCWESNQLSSIVQPRNLVHAFQNVSKNVVKIPWKLEQGVVYSELKYGPSLELFIN